MIPNSISRLESLKRFIRFSGPELWNELPHCITNKPTLNTFSNNLKKYFIHGTVHNTINTRGNNNSGNNGNHASRLTNNTGLNRPFVSRWNQWLLLYLPYFLSKSALPYGSWDLLSPDSVTLTWLTSQFKLLVDLLRLFYTSLHYHQGCPPIPCPCPPLCSQKNSITNSNMTGRPS